MPAGLGPKQSGTTRLDQASLRCTGPAVGTSILFRSELQPVDQGKDGRWQALGGDGVEPAMQLLGQRVLDGALMVGSKLAQPQSRMPSGVLAEGGHRGVIELPL